MTDTQRASAGVALVVVHYGAETLSTCVDSLLTVPGVEASAIVIVDNAGTAAGALGPHQHVEVLRPERNLGFAGAGAFGIRHCLDGGAAVVALLNDDLVVDATVGALLQAGRGEGGSGFVGPVLVEAADGRIQSAGFTWSPRTGRVRAHREPRSGRERLTGRAYLAGAFIVAEAETWRRCPLDGDLFLLYEDVDLAMRAHTMGLAVVVDHDVQVAHVGGRTLRDHGAAVSYHGARNALLMTGRYGTRLDLVLRLLVEPPHLLGAVATRLRAGRPDLLRPFLLGSIAGIRGALRDAARRR